MCFDTISTNVDIRLGIALFLKTNLKQNILHFACRHYIFEIIAEVAFSVCFGKSTAPDIAIFKEFQNQWPSIYQTSYKSMTQIDLIPKLSKIFCKSEQNVITFGQKNFRRCNHVTIVSSLSLQLSYFWEPFFQEE